MRRFLLVIALSICVTSQALAGDVPSGDYAPPPPPPDQTMSSTAPGDVPSGDFKEPSDALKALITALLKLMP